MSLPKSSQIKLVVGLGNPGSRYADTRHNIGFVVLDDLARRFGVVFKKETRFAGTCARIQVEGRMVHLLQPQTYMNLSGQSVRRALDYFKLTAEEILVLCDDIAIPFGNLRVRLKGGAGGHNGLKSIQQHVGTQDYFRLRIGIGDCSGVSSLESYVLGRFTAEQREHLDTLVKQSADATERLLREPVEHVMNDVNQKPSQKKSAESDAQATERRREDKQNAQDLGQESKNERRNKEPL